MACSSGSETVETRSDGPPAWFLEKFPEVDWDQVHMLRRNEIGTVPSALLPQPSAVKYPRWPCLICPVTFSTAEEVHAHVRLVHEAIHKFLLETPVYFTRCVVCRKFN